MNGKCGLNVLATDNRDSSGRQVVRAKEDQEGVVAVLWSTTRAELGHA